MKNLFLALFILVFTVPSFSQSKKEIVKQQSNKLQYIDSSKQRVSLNSYKNENNDLLVKEIDTDSGIVRQVLHHKKNIVLDSIDYQQVKNILFKIIGSGFDEKKYTMLHFYNKNNSKLKKDIDYKRYWKWIRKNSDHYQAFLIGTKDSHIQSNKNENVFLDSYDFFKNAFFSNSISDLNHLFIKPNGEIYIYYGIEDILSALDWSV